VCGRLALGLPLASRSRRRCSASSSLERGRCSSRLAAGPSPFALACSARRRSHSRCWRCSARASLSARAMRSQASCSTTSWPTIRGRAARRVLRPAAVGARLQLRDLLAPLGQLLQVLAGLVREREALDGVVAQDWYTSEGSSPTTGAVTTAMGSAARSCQVTGSSQMSGSTSRVRSVLRIHLEASPRYAARNSSHILARARPRPPCLGTARIRCASRAREKPSGRTGSKTGAP
jgi:hypothetical protein